MIPPLYSHDKSTLRFTLTAVPLISILLFTSCFPPTAMLGVPKGTYPCRQYLYPNSEESGFGLYGYIIFKEKPSPEDSLFYKEIYSAFLDIIETDSLPATTKIDKKRLAVIYWPVKEGSSTKAVAKYEKKNSSWPYYLDVFDYAGARLIADNLEKCSGKTGPFMVTSRFSLVSRDSMGESENDSIFVIDFSTLPVAGIKPVFRNYQNRLMKDPDFFSIRFSERLIDLRLKIACGMVSFEEKNTYLTPIIDFSKIFSKGLK